MSTPSEETGGSAVRLIFTDEQGAIRLIRQQRIDMAVTGFDAAPHVRPGDFVEVRDAAGASLTRVAIHSGLDTSLEVFPADSKGQIIRVQGPDRRRAFTVVVPARSAVKTAPFDDFSASWWVATRRSTRPDRMARPAGRNGSLWG